ncbi:MAG TPA: two-component regulator propeller domain-containing protein [Candidatus Limnocylindrales bacterium]|nr:two-component regulator propeller domain-containing protein [Candidatus Limnocylindrales bacterium]
MKNSNIFLDSRRAGRWFRKCLLAAVALGCSASLAEALDPNRVLAQYMREHWGSEKGFRGGSVTALAQTPDGYLWIGTDTGLFRFDGTAFRDFSQAAPTTLPIGPVQALTSDAQGNLWILLQSTRILRYHEGKFEVGREVAEFGITSMLKRADGSVIFASLTYGPLSYNSGKFEPLNPPTGPASPPLTGTEVTPDQLSSRLSWATGVFPHRFAEPNSAVISMAETPDGKIWLGTRDKGLFYLIDGKVFDVPTGLSSARINCLLASGSRELWIGTDKGVLRWDGERVTSLGVPPALRRLDVHSMIRDHDSSIWLGTPRGLVRVNSSGAVIDANHPQSPVAVNALFEDREGNLWAGRPSGIERFRDSTFVTYSAAGLQSESSGPVYVDQSGRVWFAPFEGGLHWLQGEKGGSVKSDRLDQDVVYSIAGTKDDLWIGRQQGGLTHLQYSGGSLTSRTYTESHGLAQNSVYAAFQSHDGAVWAGTLSGGVSEFKNGRFTTYTAISGLASNSVNSIAETSDATMWFATPNGLSAFSGGHWRSLGVREGLPSQNVNCLMTDSADLLWVGTSSGLAYLITGQMQVPTAVPASLQEQILGIAEDKLGWLWISTTNHVLRVRRDSLLRNSVGDADIREYGMEDGLQGTEGVKRQQSVFADKHGDIWFSMNRGISVANPSRAISVSPPAILHIDEVSSDGAPVNANAPIQLSGGHRRLTFALSALSLSVPERIRYKYKLEDVDEGWSRPVTDRQVTYNNLGSGEYRFRVIASNSEGEWNSAESDVSFKIRPAYWQTWWFRLSGLVFLILAVLLFFRLRMRALASQMNMRFEERLAERTRIAQELHDTLLQGFMSASMQLHVADDRLPEDSPAKPLLGRVLQLMGRVMDEGRNTVRGLRSSDVVRQNLEEEFSRIQKDLVISPQSEFRVIVEGAPRAIRPVIHDEVYFIGREALANAFRHSGASEVIAEIEYSTSHLRVMVRDNGCGVDPQVVITGRDGHWGLSGMRERAERIGGKLKVLSMTSAGTEIHLSIPSRLAFEPEFSTRKNLWFSRLYSRNAVEDKSQTASKPSK